MKLYLSSSFSERNTLALNLFISSSARCSGVHSGGYDGGIFLTYELFLITLARFNISLAQSLPLSEFPRNVFGALHQEGEDDDARTS